MAPLKFINTERQRLPVRDALHPERPDSGDVADAPLHPVDEGGPEGYGVDLGGLEDDWGAETFLPLLNLWVGGRGGDSFVS